MNSTLSLIVFIYVATWIISGIVGEINWLLHMHRVIFWRTPSWKANMTNIAVIFIVLITLYATI